MAATRSRKKQGKHLLRCTLMQVKPLPVRKSTARSCCLRIITRVYCTKTLESPVRRVS